MIEPTPGRVVWYRPGLKDPLRSIQDGDRPLAAHVAWVNSPRSVNLMVIDRGGRPHGRVHVQLLQDGDALNLEGDSFCEWMPFQKGQAAKVEQQLAGPANNIVDVITDDNPNAAPTA